MKPGEDPQVTINGESYVKAGSVVITEENKDEVINFEGQIYRMKDLPPETQSLVEQIEEVSKQYNFYLNTSRMISDALEFRKSSLRAQLKDVQPQGQAMINPEVLAQLRKPNPPKT